MDFREMEYIISIAKHQNLTKAAEELYLSQPALSIFLKNFENELGIKLFKREGKKFVATYAGEYFVRNAQIMLHLRKNLENQLSNIESVQKTRLSVGMVQARAVNLIPKILPVYAKSHPNVNVTVVERNSDELRTLLNEGKLDIAILNERPEAYSNLASELLQKDEAVLCVSRHSPICQKAKQIPSFSYPWLDIRELSNEHIMVAGAHPKLVLFFRNLLKSTDMYFNEPTHFNNVITAVRLVSEGYGICYSFYDPAIFVENAEIRFFSIGTTSLKREVVLAYRQDYLIPDYVSDFIKILKSVYPHPEDLPFIMESKQAVRKD